MHIKLMVRHSHHDGIPKFSCEADDWDEANNKLTAGLNVIREENMRLIKNHEGVFALRCGIIDFILNENNKVTKGQFGFSIDNINKTIKEYVHWYNQLQVH